VIPLRRREQISPRGFTLVELLVALLVLSIATALVSAKLFESDRNRGQRQIERLAASLEHAALAAQWRSRNILWQMHEQRSEFQIESRADDGPRWTPILDEPQLSPQAMPDGMRLAEFQRAGQASAQARLIFAAHGINEPFEFVAALGENAWRLRGDALGRVSVTSP